jgi:hypothetical protein
LLIPLTLERKCFIISPLILLSVLSALGRGCLMIEISQWLTMISYQRSR